MSAEGRDLETLAREEPEAVREVADMEDDELQDWLLGYLEDAENGGGSA